MRSAAALLTFASVALAMPLNFTLSKRQTYSNERFTWYNVDVGLGSCGQEFQDSDFVVAMNIEQYDSSMCWEDITITVGSLSTTAMIVDMVSSPDNFRICTLLKFILVSRMPYGGLDLSPGLFDYFTWPGAAGSSTDPGVLTGSWSFGGSSSGGGGVTIHPNGDESKCLDVSGANYANGTPVDIYDCNGTGAQQWVINSGTTAVQVAGTNYCLDAGDSPADGTQMKIWECYSGIAAQTWYYTSDDRISLQNQGFCLDLTNGDETDGNVMQIWECTDDDTNQVWTLN
ncbi:hypothetical protein NM688_g2600 [Phlebia brevispora]|uniref:Uncharacterized protein n=1 Tax=Phlebia brevispora TaxID=194682 RepID=A0ACC1T8D2_9APHY|nr:hypothetical protein NM688_g2600 [Phlebia brevispora]